MLDAAVCACFVAVDLCLLLVVFGCLTTLVISTGQSVISPEANVAVVICTELSPDAHSVQVIGKLLKLAVGHLITTDL